ncbi:acyltransferase [Blastococcus sp. TML/M2B]|uniref:acyltransferase family protein n=1 Tax=Blastococcus sp. TML/M2B TaxID=2798727 RepID=UPI00190B92C3|nr:acyltransferase [Blastococcus sp. TML/M2B]MBN1093783.1 acyltransferase [Blastococcus sp. TML/M2B]
MTASAVLDGGPAAAQERAFPALDGMRIIAAVAVVVSHTASRTGASVEDGYGASMLSHLGVGVAVFFVLSGFLLFRPFPSAAARGVPAPGAGAYLWRRALRILPAYWVTVAAAVLFLPDNTATGADVLLRYLTLTQIYDDNGFTTAHGLDHVWSLSTEVAFYAVLPLLAAGLVWLSRGRPDRPWPALLALLGLTVAGSVFLYVAMRNPWELYPTNIWLPSLFGWFAGGMALALLTVADPDWAPVRAARALGGHLGVCWLGAAAFYAVACTPVAGPHNYFDPAGPAELVIRNLLHMGVAVLLVLPLVLGQERGGPVRRALSGTTAHRLGEISYGVFLVHVPLLTGLYSWLALPALNGGFIPVTVLVLGASVTIAAGMYAAVERPLRRFRTLVPDRSRAAAPAPGRHQAPAAATLATVPAVAVPQHATGGTTP